MTSELPEPNDWEVTPTGKHLMLDPSSIHSAAADAAMVAKDVRILELEAENQSLRLKLMTAEAALKFTPEQIESLKGVVNDMSDILKEDRLHAAA